MDTLAEARIRAIFDILNALRRYARSPATDEELGQFVREITLPCIDVIDKQGAEKFWRERE